MKLILEKGAVLDGITVNLMQEEETHLHYIVIQEEDGNITTVKVNTYESTE